MRYGRNWQRRSPGPRRIRRAHYPTGLGTEMDWFSGWHWAIVAVVFLVLFGSSRLPGAARALGSSMNIFKRSLKEGMSEDGKPAENANITQATVLPPPQPLNSAQAEP